MRLCAAGKDLLWSIATLSSSISRERQAGIQGSSVVQ